VSANGSLRSSELASIGQHCRLALGPAAVWRAAETAAAKVGVKLLVEPTPDYPGMAAYRDRAAQRYLLAHYSGALHLSPVGQSTHGTGRAIDVAQPGRAWLIAHGRRYGIVQTNPSADPAHFAFTIAAASLGIAPIESTQISKEQLMSTTIPVSKTVGKIKTFSRYRDGVIESTTDAVLAMRWCLEVGYDGKPITANATKYLADWQERQKSDRDRQIALIKEAVGSGVKVTADNGPVLEAIASVPAKTRAAIVKE
jgi:hypothetical protein